MTKRLVALLLTLTMVFGTLGLTAVGADAAAAPEAPAAKLKAPEIVTVNGETAVKAGDGRTDYTSAYITGYDANGNWKSAELQYDQTAGAYVRITNQWSDTEFVLEKLYSVQFNKNVSSEDGMSETVDSANYRYDYSTGVLESAELQKGTRENQIFKYTWNNKNDDNREVESSRTLTKSEDVVITSESYNTSNGKVSEYSETTKKATYTPVTTWSWSDGEPYYTAKETTEDSSTSRETYTYEDDVITRTSKNVYTTNADGKTSTQAGTSESAQYNSESGKMTSTTKNTYSYTNKLNVDVNYTDSYGKQQTRPQDVTIKSSSDVTTTEYDAKSGAQTQTTHAVTEYTGDEKTRTTTVKSENTTYNTETGKVSSTTSRNSTSVDTAVASQSGWLNYRTASNNGTTEEKQYDNTDGTYTGKTERTYEYTYNTEGDSWGETLSSKTTRKEYDEKDVLTYTSEDQSSTKYNAAKDARTYTSSGNTAEYDHGIVIATGKSSSTRDDKYEVLPDTYNWEWDNEKQEYVQVPAKGWNEQSSSSDKTRYNAAGTVVYSYKSSSEGDKSSSEEMSYDKFGKLSSGSKSNSTKTTYHSESYDQHGIRETKDQTKNDDGQIAKETIVRYYNVKNGKNIKSFESISEPELVKNDNGSIMRTLNHTKRYDYDSFGGVLDSHTYDQTYDSTNGATTTTYTIVNYVGKPVEAEMHDKVVSVTVQYGSDKNYDKSTIKTTYDWDGKVEEIYKSAQETVTDKNGRQTVTDTSGTFEADGKTLISGTIYVNGYDEKGNYFYKYSYANGSGYTRNYEYGGSYDDNSYYRNQDYTYSDGTSSSEKFAYDSTAKEYKHVRTYYDADEKTVGKVEYGVYQYDANKNYIGYDDVYTNAKGEVVYKYQTRYTDNGTTYTYVDASGKEIGYERTDSEKGITSNKTPKLNTDDFTLDGWTEYTSTRTKGKTEAGDEVTYYVYENKTYNADSILTRETKTDNYGTSYVKEYTEEGKLKSDAETDAKQQKTTTYYENPGNVLSKVEKTNLQPVKDATTGRTTSQVNSDVAYYGLDGKLDRHTIETVSYEYDKDGNNTKTTTTTEYRDSTDKAIVTKTSVYDETDKNNWKEETVKADGTVIGYVKYSGFETEKVDTTTWQYLPTTDSAGYTTYSWQEVPYSYYEYSSAGTREEVAPTINAYTGKVISTSETKSVTGKDGSYSSTTVNKKGNEVTSESAYTSDAKGNRSETSKSYSDASYDNKGYYLTSERSYTYDAATETSKSEGKSYHYSGSVAYSWTSESTYDKDENQYVTTRKNYNSDGDLVYTQESISKDTAYGQSSTGSIVNTVYKDAKGNEIGYSKVDASGNSSSKTPGTYSYSGNLNGKWTERTENADGTVVTSKSYDENGVLTSEYSYTYATTVSKSNSSYPNSEAIKSYGWYGASYDTAYTLTYGGTYGYNTESDIISGSRKDYWPDSSVVKTETVYTDLGNGKIEKVTTVYNEDGSLRTKAFEEEGRETGTHFIDKSGTYYAANESGLGQFLYGYEYRYDLQKDEITEVYTNAAGKVVGHGETKNADGSISSLEPTSFNGRTGEILSYYEEGTDAKGNEYAVEYDKNMKETHRWIREQNEDGDVVTSSYKNGETKPYDVTVGVKSTAYNSKGEIVNSDEAIFTNNYNSILVPDRNYYGPADNYEWYSDGTIYYNQNGDLTYTYLGRVRTADYTNIYSVYLGSDGKEIGRTVTDDDGNYYSKVPQTTIAKNIIGYEEEITLDGGKTEIKRGYDKDNKLIGETYRYTNRVITDEDRTTTITNKDGRTVSIETEELNQITGATDKRTTKYFSLWNGQNYGTTKRYYTDPDFNYEYKYYDENGNVTDYGWSWDYNDYRFSEANWVNGNLASYNWYDTLYNSNASHYESYNPDGSYSHWEDYGTDESYIWDYDSNGKILSYTESKNGVTNVYYYNADGSISGYDWGITNTESNFVDYRATDSVVWNATAPIYKKHVESNLNDKGTIETWTDNAGNVKTITRGDETTSTVKLASTANGWQQAFGDEWYYVEGGKPATGWKVVGGTWYYFNEDGQMATGVVNDGSATYVMSDSGAWNASGWSQDENGSWAYSENGVAATGWRNLGGTWYYFDDGWYINYGEYDSQIGWKQGTPGTMVTGAAHIWDSDWNGTTTYFFNADGSWDTSAGWKSDGIDYYYFYAGGERAKGWQLIDGTWYYFNDKGVMRNGWVSSGPSWYYMNEDGSMAANSWIQERFEDDWYYADGSGLMATGWKQIDGAWYYFDASGVMAANEWVGNYYQDASGAMVTGWNQIDDNWYYMGDSGEAQYGWQQIGGIWYYFNDSAAMVTGEVEIGGVVNVFDANGAWQGTK